MAGKNSKNIEKLVDKIYDLAEECLDGYGTMECEEVLIEIKALIEEYSQD